ncbi:hypothetical protein NHX12_015620 [Muraenolepis orangiensis]|uniref:Uncharacterized protein n=1 Tax=Muraenolepis orangiensis TaxID=630683 RepID=A0A9Q0D8R1_9TELE|nr:hypothetical protein NHX12_015620 [Muraenolepis orangiensis]
MNCISKVCFKEQILKYFPQAQEQSDGKNVILVFKEGMQDMPKQALKWDYEEDVLFLAKAARLWFKLNALFPSQCQQNSIPTNLKSLVTMVLVGADLNDQSSADSQACLTVSHPV